MPKLTKTAVDNLTAGEKDAWIWDTEVPGFGVRCQPGGRKTYVIRYRNQDHVQRKMTIGRVSDLTPDQARQIARKHFATIADGQDPAEAKRERLQAPTIADLSERYMREHAIPFKKPKSVYDDDGLWRRVIVPKMGTKRVDAITRSDVVSLHASMSGNPGKANHTLALLSKAMNLAELWGWRTGTNPCRHVKKYRTNQRDVILTVEQIKALNAVLDRPETDPRMRDLVRLLMLTGCRLSEIMTARRDWVDADRRLLLLPDSKVGQRRIALPSAAMAIIEAMPKGQEWLIPGRIAGEHMKSPHRRWHEIASAAGLPAGVRMHDLRHTFGSLGHRLGLSQRQIATLLGHKALITTERYLHGYASEVSENVEAVAAVIAGTA